MPTYEYECAAGHRYETREGFDAPPAQKCQKCRRIARRVLHAPSVVFKGSGFYVTDSRKPAPNGAEASSASEASSDSTSDAKPESKGETSSSESTSKDAATPPKADKAAATS